MRLTTVVSAYNHAPWVEAAIRSVLDQRADFAHDIVVVEDCSTDGTREIVQSLAAEHPDRVRLSLSEVNLNSNAVLRRGFELVRGEYVALLDGDDVWTAPDKLQRQVDLLDARPDWAAAFHDVEVVYADRSAENHRFYAGAGAGPFSRTGPRRESGLADIVRGDFVATCSVVLRADVIRRLPAWYDRVWSGDWPLLVLAAERGKLGYIDAVMAAYRVHSGGLWTRGVSRYRTLEDVERIVDVYDTLNEHLQLRFDREIQTEVADLYERVAHAAYGRRDLPLIRACALRSFRRRPPRQWPAHRRLAGRVARAAVRGMLGQRAVR